MAIYSVVDDHSEKPVSHMGYMLQVCVASCIHVGTLHTLMHCAPKFSNHTYVCNIGVIFRLFLLIIDCLWFESFGALSVLLTVWEQNCEMYA